MPPFSDNHLIRSCIDGNQAHCRLLYERYKKLVAGLAYNYCHDSELARDLTQEIFLKAFKKLKSFEGKSSYKNWLAKIAKNTCIDYHKRKEHQIWKNHVQIDSENERIKDIPDDKEKVNPEYNIQQWEKDKVVRAAIEKLKLKHKTVILLLIEGFSYDEIAEITEQSKGTVSSRIHYAKKKLMKILKRYFKGSSR